MPVQHTLIPTKGSPMNKRTIALALVIPAAALALSACGSSAGTSSSGSMPGHDMSAMTSDESMTGGLHNAADIAFAQDMIPHHQQAVEMAEMASTRASSPEVKKLAAQIEAAQSPEIKQMTGWLKAWGASVPADHDSMSMGDHDMSDMPGMMPRSEMADLTDSDGAAFDQMFLMMMIAHHQGALTMARTVKADGASPDVADLAADIISGQTAEIATMKRLVAQA